MRVSCRRFTPPPPPALWRFLCAQGKEAKNGGAGSQERKAIFVNKRAEDVQMFWGESFFADLKAVRPLPARCALFVLGIPVVALVY